MQAESRCRGEKRRDICLFGLVLPTETRGPDPRHVERLSVQVRLALRCLVRNGSFLDNQHRAKPTRWSTSTRVEVERRTHGSLARRARSFRPFADTGANVPSEPHGCPYSAMVQDQRPPQAVWSLQRAFGRASERRPALGHAANSYEVSGWKAELERRKLLERYSRRPRHDLHRRRESKDALKGSHVSSAQHEIVRSQAWPSDVRALLDHFHGVVAVELQDRERRVVRLVRLEIVVLCVDSSDELVSPRG
jgi:hypothetical protein